MTLKESCRIADCFKDRNPTDMLPGVQVLNHNSDISQSAIDIIKRFNLLPNDALILATCKHFEIEYLASFDSDFEVPCNALGIHIFNDKVGLKDFMHSKKLAP
jgi:predicted nucleic acid-binding protein